MARLETTFLDSAKTVEKLSKSRRLAATAVNELGDQTNTFAMSETYAPLAGGFKRLARSIKVDADLAALQVSQRSLFTPMLYTTDWQSQFIVVHQRVGPSRRCTAVSVFERSICQGDFVESRFGIGRSSCSSQVDDPKEEEHWEAQE